MPGGRYVVVKMRVTNYLNIFLEGYMLVVRMVVTNYLNIFLVGDMLVVKMAVTNYLNIPGGRYVGSKEASD